MSLCQNHNSAYFEGPQTPKWYHLLLNMLLVPLIQIWGTWVLPSQTDQSISYDRISPSYFSYVECSRIMCTVVRLGSSKKNCHRCQLCHRFRGDRVISSKFSVAVLTDTAIVRLFDGRKLPSDGIWWQWWQWWQYCHSPLQIQNNRNKSMNQFQIIHLLSIFTQASKLARKEHSKQLTAAKSTQHWNSTKKTCTQFQVIPPSLYQCRYNHNILPPQ